MVEIQSAQTVIDRMPEQRGRQRSRGLIVTACGLFLLILGIGCRSHQQTVDTAHLQYWSGDWEKSAATLNEAIKRPRMDTDVLTLDQAMVEFQRGNLTESQQLFRTVRDRISEQPIGRNVVNSLAYLSDESHRVYSAEDHEQILLYVMLTFSSLLNDDGDATAYAHQMGDQCQRLLDDRPLETVPDTNQQDAPNSQIGNVEQKQFVVDQVRRELAIAPLLRSLIRGQSRLNHDELIRNLQTANQWRPHSPFLQTELARAINNEQAPAGCGTLYLFAFVGKGPRKIETSETVSSQALLLADQLLSSIGEYSLPPTIAPIKIAKIQQSVVTIDRLEVLIDQKPIGNTENVADIGQLAVARQAELMPSIIARGVARRVVKKGVVVAGKKASGVDKNKKSDLTSFAYDAAGVIWEAAEKADLRSWTLLPGSIQILRIDLPAGKHQLTAIPSLHGRTNGSGFSGAVEIYDGRSTFAVASIADANASGQLVQQASDKE